MGGSPVTLDFSKAQPISLDFSKAEPLEPKHDQPDNFWDTVYDRSGLGAIQKLSASLADWAEKKAASKEDEHLTEVAQGQNPKAYSSPEMAGANYDLLARGARFVSGAFHPKNLATTALVAAANTNPVTGIPVDAALAAHGAYGVASNAREALKGNPQAAQDALLSGAEMVGGAAGTAGQVGKVGPAISSAAPKLYQSALKPPPGSYSTAEVQNMVKTGLENKIPVSSEGVGKLGGLIKDLNKVVDRKSVV